MKVGENLENNQENYTTAPIAPTQHRRKSMLSSKPFFTYVFMMISFAMFALLELSGGSTNSNTLINFGAKFNPLILEGEWWRFLTPIFLHIGFFHLLMNTFALFYIGGTVERIFGRIRFLFIYLFAGFGGVLASFIFSPNLSAGASGAIFGCFGALLYFGVIYPKLFLKTMGWNVVIVIVINLALGFYVPGIDNAGHIGGLIGGFLATGVVHFPRSKKVFLQSVFLIASLILSGGLLYYGFQNPEVVLDETSITIMAQQYMQDEDYETAYQYLSEIEDEDAETPQYYFLLSFAEIRLGKLDVAKESLLKAIELDEDFHEAHYNLSLVYLEEGNMVKAKEHVAKAAEINPNKQEYQDLINQFP